MPGIHREDSRPRVACRRSLSFAAIALLLAARSSGADCDRNGLDDDAEIAAVPGLDCDGNRLLDACEVAQRGIAFVEGGLVDGFKSATPADVDGDGDVDLVSLVSPSRLAVAFNRGGGVFLDDRFLYELELQAVDVALGDLDGDGDLDYALTSHAERAVIVLENGGGGRVATVTRSGLLDYPHAVGFGDFDSDGRADMIAVATWPGQLFLLRGTGSLGFQVSDPIASTDRLPVVVADVNGDRRPDVLSAPGPLRVLEGRGDGTFLETKYAAASTPSVPAVADIDGDGDLDAALPIYNDGEDEIAVLFNDGRGAFDEVRRFPTGKAPGTLLAGDFDLDADIDLISFPYAVSESPLWGGIVFHWNLGGGLVAESAAHEGFRPWRPGSAADLDGDGDLDLLVEGSSSSPTGGSLRVLLNEAAPAEFDCNGNGLLDACEPLLADCNLNLIPDGCEIQSGRAADCNANSVPDDCEPDCDGNGRPDDCDLEAGALDRDRSGIPDACEVARLDCNLNGAADAEDLAGGASLDCDGNGTPDECDVEPRIDLRQDYFERHGVGFRGGDMAAADLDRDGDLDLAFTKGPDCSAYRCRRGGVVVFLRDAGGRFLEAGDYATSDRPALLEVIDLDADGDEDLVVANRPLAAVGKGSISVLANRGNGTFSPASTFGKGPVILRLAGGDLDGDGAPDLAVLRSGVPGAILFMNDGHGALDRGEIVLTGASLDMLELADADGDADLDLVTWDRGTGEIGLALNAGNAGFREIVKLHSTRTLRRMEAGDLDADGDADIVVGESDAEAAITILWNRGPGVYVAGEPRAVGARPSLLSVRDLDGDGDQDVVAAGPATGADPSAPRGAASVLLNRGAGELEPSVESTTVIIPNHAILGDFDGDGVPELVTREWGHDAIVTSRYDGEGKFPTRLEAPVGMGPHSIAAADLDGDGAIDIVTADEGARSLTVLRNRGGAAFETVSTRATEGSPSAIIAADLDGDADSDVAVIVEAGIEVFLNTDGSFTTSQRTRIGSRPVAIAAGDLDGDGDVDLVTANDIVGPLPDNLSILMNDGSGRFSSPRNFGLGLDPTSIVVGDVDADGTLDIVAATCRSRDIRVLRGEGGGHFAAPVSMGTGACAEALLLADLDVDGDLDVAFLAVDGVHTLSNDGSGAFRELEKLTGGSGAFAARDLDGDGAPEIIRVKGGSIAVHPNTGGSFLEPVRFLTGFLKSRIDESLGRGPPVGSLRSMAVADLDADGDLDLAIPYFHEDDIPYRRINDVSIILNDTPRRAADRNQDGVPDRCEPPGVPRFRRGEVNADGTLDVSDALKVLRHLFTTGEALDCASAADANDDGRLEITDPIVILRALFTGEVEIPLPFMACGLDATPDALGCGAFPPCGGP